MPSKQRRNFVKKASSGVVLGMFGGLLLTVPRKAEAFVWEIPAAVAEYFRLGKEYYEQYVEEWVDRVDELKDVFNSDDPMIPVILAKTDAANHIRVAIENARRQRELMPPPSDQCAGQNAAQAAELMESIQNDLSRERSEDAMLELKRIAADQRDYQAGLVKEINTSIKQRSLEEALETLNATVFVGDKGYEDPQISDQFFKAIMARARLAVSESAGVNKRQMTNAATFMSRMSVCENALSKIMTRRIPTETAYQKAYESALPYEQEILSSMRVNRGISQVDIENFESRRTHESLTWHRLVEDSSSATAMCKELSLLQAASNDLDVKIHEIQTLINQNKSIRTLNESESTTHPKRKTGAEVSEAMQLFIRRGQS